MSSLYSETANSIQGFADDDVCTHVLHNLPALIREDGSVHVLRDAKRLLRYNVSDGDLYVVNAHGEIVPFIALAIRQRLINCSGELFHIDAHLDNLHEATSIVRRANGFSCSEHCHSSIQTQQSITRFLGADSEHEADAFADLVQSTQGDIATFIAAMRLCFSKITARIRSRGGFAMRTYGPMTMEAYVDEEHSTTGNGKSEATSQSSRVYSIDGDVTGIVGEDPWYVGGKDFRKRMKILLSMLHTLAQEDLREEVTTPRLYTLSLDPAWCAYPREFLQQFLRARHSQDKQYLS